MKRVVSFIFGVWLLTGASLAGNDGGVLSPFSLGAGSRSLAMGAADMAATDASTAAYWNPARLAQAERFAVTGFYTQLFDSDVGYQYLGLALPTIDYGTFGIGVFNLGITGIEERDADNLLLGSFKDNRLAFYLSYGRMVSNYNVGIALSMEHHSINDYTATSSPGIDLSAGRTFKFSGHPLDIIALSLNARNVVKPGYKLITETVKYPSGVEAGITTGLKISNTWNQSALFAFSVSKYNFMDPRINAGLEYGFDSTLMLRGGVRDGKPSGGFGISYKGISFDYALVDRDLGSLHMFSLSTSFGASVMDKRAERIQKREAEFQGLMQNQLEERNRSLISELVRQGETELAEANLVEAGNSFDRALFLATSHDYDTTAIAEKLSATRERLGEIERLHRYSELIDSASTRLSLSDYWSARYYAGMALKENETSDEALRIIAEADRALDSKYSREEKIQNQLLLADSLLNYGRLDEALHVLGGLQTIAADNSAVKLAIKKAEFEQWKAAVMAAGEIKDFTGALQALDSAQAIFPGHQWCLAMRSQITQDIRQQQSAQIVAPIVIQAPLGAKLEKEVLDIYNEAQRKFKQGELAAAIQGWERVEHLAPDFQSVRQYLINAYKFVGVDLYGQNKLDEAIAVWRKAERFDPKNTEIADYINRTEAEIVKLRELSYEAR